MGVSSIVIDYGGLEDEAIAALLHDGPEDQGGTETLDEIRARFGEHVAELVEACTDTFEKPKPRWRARKEQYLSSINHKSESALLVSAADKLHNARSILRDYRLVGDHLWDRFRTGSSGDQLWYYRSLVAAFKGTQAYNEDREFVELVNELHRTVTAIEELADAGRG